MANVCKSTHANASTNPAKEAKLLLDMLSHAQTVATVLSETRSGYGDFLPHSIVANLEVLVHALWYLNQEGQYQTARVSSVKYLIRGYNMRSLIRMPSASVRIMFECRMLCGR